MGDDETEVAVEAEAASWLAHWNIPARHVAVLGELLEAWKEAGRAEGERRGETKMLEALLRECEGFQEMWEVEVWAESCLSAGRIIRAIVDGQQPTGEEPSDD